MRAMATVVCLALLAPGCGYFEAKRQREALAKHEAERAKKLAEGLADLGSQKWQDQLKGTARIASEGAKNRKLVEVIPQAKVHHEQLSACVELASRVVRAAAEKQSRQMVGLAAEGLLAAGTLLAEFQAQGDKAIANTAGVAPGTVQYFTALLTTTVALHGVFANAAGLILLNAPAAERMAAFESVAGVYVKVVRPGGRSPVGLLLQQAWAQEDDPGNKPKMEQALRLLNLPLPSREPDKKAAKN